ncbi:hypothetical protein MCUN1_000928 [Malassezia cuniculi]|uniref:RRM domain-containing protein n=1 Tax=Malassezia cuniculi TaxID=948313 RepID=A0AAF0JAA3_9BASI|nr:hypothetical protein MCUN1_000928 [Malassezia cuniculi]
MSSHAPNTALYVKNINSQVKKEELRRQLYTLFATYGRVIDVVATRAPGMRGQAFVVFRDQPSATAALNALDGFEFYDKPLALQYARTKANATIVAEYGEDALRNPAILRQVTAGQPVNGRVTFSHAQAEAHGQKRPGEISPDRRPAKSQRVQQDEESEEEEVFVWTLD